MDSCSKSQHRLARELVIHACCCRAQSNVVEKSIDFGCRRTRSTSFFRRPTRKVQLHDRFYISDPPVSPLKRRPKIFADAREWVEIGDPADSIGRHYRIKTYRQFGTTKGDRSCPQPASSEPLGSRPFCRPGVSKSSRILLHILRIPRVKVTTTSTYRSGPSIEQRLLRFFRGWTPPVVGPVIVTRWPEA